MTTASTLTATLAPTPPAGSAAVMPELSTSLGQMAFALVVVIALLFASLWVLRRLSAPRGGSAALKVLGAAAVGPRERVVLVEIGDQVLVLGVAPGRVSKLHDMSREALQMSLPPGDPSTPETVAKGFAAWLKQAHARRRGGAG